MKKWFSRALILLFLATLAGAPPILYGYWSLSRAQTAPTDISASLYVESAARMLFWQPQLYEKAGLQAAENPPRAIRLMNLAQQNGVLSDVGRIALGDAYLASAETSKAMAEWEMVLSKKQAVESVCPRLAAQYHARQDYSNEQRVLSTWLEADRKNPQANEWMGRILAASAAAEALPMLQIAAASSPQASRRLEALISALQNPIEQAGYRLALSGQALAQMDEWPLAETAFERAASASPRYASAWAWLGIARQHNHSAGAQAALEYAVKLDGGSAAIHAMLGNYWQYTGETKKAIYEFQFAASIEPGNAAWWLALAGAQAQTDLSAALNAYIKAVNIAPQQADYWYALAAFCVEKNAYVEDYGLNAALRAFALQPESPAYVVMLGRAQMAAGLYDVAEISFNKALSLGPPSSMPGYHFQLGLLYLQTDRMAQARFEFEQTLALEPAGAYGSQAKILIERYFPQK